MKKTEANLTILTGIFVTALVISNVLASKIVKIGVLEFPAAVVAYPLTFLVTDLIGEIWGKKQAQRTVWIGFGCELLALLMIYIAIALPVPDYMVDFSQEFKDVLSQTARVALASLCAYLVSQSWDIVVFHYFRKGHWADHKWMRNNFSTMTSQAFDTVIFISIAFIGVVPDIGIMMISQYVVKIILAICDTPFFYLLTRDSLEQNPIEN